MLYNTLYPNKFSQCLERAECTSAPYVIILQLYPNEIGLFPFPAQCTSAVLTHTTVVSELLSHFTAVVLEEK